MINVEIIWDPEDYPRSNVRHIGEHGVSAEEVEEVLLDPASRTSKSRSSQLPITFGWTSTGRYIAVIWEEYCKNPRMIHPVTAYDAPPPQGRQI